MRALGAEIINTPKEKGMLGSIERSRELLNNIPNSISLRQFENKDNPNAHYLTTGSEIYKDMEENIDYFVASAGSGGTFTGVTSYLKEKSKNIKSILVDLAGSTMGGGNEGCYGIKGIGNNFIPDTMDMGLVDKIIKVNDEESFHMVRELSKRKGLIVGSSLEAALAGALKLSQFIDRGNISYSLSR